MGWWINNIFGVKVKNFSDQDSMPMLSIIIPAYNSVGTLPRCLESILRQTDYERVEVIVVDDGSTDSTHQLLTSTYSHKGFRFFRNAERKGASYSRNIGIRHAVGEWIMFVDADDELPPDALTILINEGKKSSVDVIVGAYIKQRHHGEALQSKHGLQMQGTLTVTSLSDYVEKYIFEPYKYTLLVHCWGKIYRRRIAVKNDIYFDESLEQLEDVNFNFNFIRCSPALRYVDRPCYLHYIHQSNSMSSRSGSEEAAVKKICHAYEPISQFLLACCEMDAGKVSMLWKHLVFTTAIIWLTRIKRRFYKSTITQIADRISPVILSPLLRKCITSYKPMPDDSRLLYLSVMLGSPLICSLALVVEAFFKRRQLHGINN